MQATDADLLLLLLLAGSHAFCGLLAVMLFARRNRLAGGLSRVLLLSLRLHGEQRGRGAGSLRLHLTAVVGEAGARLEHKLVLVVQAA